MLASHAVLIGLTFGLIFTLVLMFGPALLNRSAATASAAQAIGRTVFFGGAVSRG